MFKKKVTTSKPCWPMRVLVSAWVDGALAGLAERYTAWHIAHCPQCSSAVPFFRQLHRRLQSLDTQDHAQRLSEERWAKIESAWEHADQQALK